MTAAQIDRARAPFHAGPVPLRSPGQAARRLPLGSTLEHRIAPTVTRPWTGARRGHDTAPDTAHRAVSCPHPRLDRASTPTPPCPSGEVVDSQGGNHGCRGRSSGPSSGLVGRRAGAHPTGEER